MNQVLNMPKFSHLMAQIVEVSDTQSHHMTVTYLKVEVSDTQSQMTVTYLEVEVPDTQSQMTVTCLKVEVSDTQSQMTVTYLKVEVSDTQSQMTVTYLKVEVPDTQSQMTVTYLKVEVRLLIQVEVSDTQSQMTVTYLKVQVSDTQSQMTVTYLKDINILLSFIFAARTSNFNLHLQSERQLLNLIRAFDCVHYTRYNIYHHVLLSEHKRQNMQVYNDLINGGFTAPCPVVKYCT